MKKLYSSIILALLVLKSTTGFSTTHTIINSGFTFSPDSVSAIIGDTVIFSLNTFHFPKEVSQASWNNNDSTSNGGFVLPNGGGMLVLTQAKTYYYVCGIHFASGMKGRIFVSNSSGINSLQQGLANLDFTQNPAVSNTVVKSNLLPGKQNRLRVYAINGSLLYEKSNVSSEEFLDVSTIAPGVYFVELSAENIVLVKKLVISR